MRTLFLLLLLCTLTAGARPLEDRAATVKRYGANRNATALKPATEALAFKIGPLDLTCHLLKGVVIAEEYELHSLWTDDGIAELLAKNVGDSEWKEIENGFWRRADGKLVARHLLRHPTTMLISTPAWDIAQYGPPTGGAPALKETGQAAGL